MLLKKLIDNSPKRAKNIDVKGLASNSNDVKKGFIFFAIKGKKINGEKFIDQAIKKGAIIIICSQKCKFISSKAIIIKKINVRASLSQVASKFYKLKPKNIIAVTGTNGKTSVADFFYQLFKLNNLPVASIGTLGIKYGNKNIKSNLTSPDIITLHKNLETIKKKKIDNVIIEASSHGLHQNRLDNLKIKAGIFTNFSQDHLDYHKTMKNYLDSKLILFSKILTKGCFAICDQSIKQYSVIKKISDKKNLKLRNIEKKLEKLKNMKIPLIGKFQLKNLAMAILAAQICNLKNNQILKSLIKIKNVSGRLELVKVLGNNIKVFIDYAHTPDALLNVIKTIKKEISTNVSLVFGCGGDRDKSKRAIMANIARSHCNKIFVTDDNPRNENPKKIRKEIIKHLKKVNYFNIGSRKKAIEAALKKAEPFEAILVAGKGHENYQDFGKKIITISDKEIIQNLKIKNKKLNKKDIEYNFNSKIINKILKSNKIYNFDGLSIDSRNVVHGNLFLALKGKTNDGNQFISHAFKKGAKCVVTSKKNTKFEKKIILSSNPRDFLNKFAKLKRENSKATIIAITGSAGKTSLKDILQKILQKYDETYASPKSYNNHYGVPVSLSNLKSHHKFGVFEVGMSKKGEINQLSKIIKPNLAVITNIGEAHAENFKNVKGIAKAKSEIIDNVKTNGVIFLNRDDKFFSLLKQKAQFRNLKIITFGKSNLSDVNLISEKNIGGKKKLVVKVFKNIIKLTIKNINVYNVLACLAILRQLNLKFEKAIKLFGLIEPSEGRGKVHSINRYKKSFKLIDESYNANPLSVKIALRNFTKIKKNNSKKYLILGDMLELGRKSKIYHQKLSGLINSSDIDKVFVKGENSLFTYKNIIKHKRGNILQSNQDIDFILKNIIANNDYLMIKGSNATGLNNISKAMIKGI